VAAQPRRHGIGSSPAWAVVGSSAALANTSAAPMYSVMLETDNLVDEIVVALLRFGFSARCKEGEKSQT
jgi:hypothetical protein